MRAPLLAALSAIVVFAQSPAARWTDLNTQGSHLFAAGQFSSAQSKFSAALTLAQTFGDTDPRYWATLTNLGLASQRLGDFIQSEPLLRRAADLRERALGPDDPSVAHALVNYAGALRAAHRPADADPLLRRALSIAESSGNPALIAEALNSLSLLLMDQREYARAEPILRRAAALFSRLGDGRSLESAKTINNLAMLYTNQQDYGKAEAELRLAIPLYEKNLGPSHPELIGPLNNMFTVLAAQQRFDEGEPYLRRALAIAARGTAEPIRAVQLYSNLGALQSYRGDYRSSAQTFSDVITTIDRTFGPTDPMLAGPLTAYANALRHLHRSADARQATERASLLKAAKDGGL